MDWKDDSWEPIFKEDFGLEFTHDPIDYMKHQVFRKNEAWDMRIIGGRGLGKSTVGLSLSLLMKPELLDMSPQKVLDKCWCFTTEERNNLKKHLKRGDVLVMDEQGTRNSGSSYKWSSEENQELADSRQVDRVDGVMEIGITLDEMRVVKRVREVYKVEVYPQNKLTSEENGGRGLAIDCIFREITEQPFVKSGGDKHKSRYFRYEGGGGRVTRMTIPHPPVDLWNEYMKRRRDFKMALEDAAQIKKEVGENILT